MRKLAFLFVLLACAAGLLAKSVPVATVITVPNPMPFRDVPVGQTGNPTQLTILSTGSLPATFLQFAEPPNYHIVTNNCPVAPASLAPGQSCRLYITCTSTQLGWQSETLLIFYSPAATGSSPYRQFLDCKGI